MRPCTAGDHFLSTSVGNLDAFDLGDGADEVDLVRDLVLDRPRPAGPCGGHSSGHRAWNVNVFPGGLTATRGRYLDPGLVDGEDEGDGVDDDDDDDSDDDDDDDEDEDDDEA